MREHFEQTERDFVNLIIDEFHNRTEYIEYIGIPLIYILKKTLNADSIKVDYIDDELIYTKSNPVFSEPHAGACL